MASGINSVLAFAARPGRRYVPFILSAVCLLIAPNVPDAAELSETIKRVRPSIVAVGTYQQTRRPPANLRGTGFAVGDGLHVLTNSHVVPDSFDGKNKERLAVFVGRGKKVNIRIAEVVARDANHDVALLKIPGPALPVLHLGDGKGVAEGHAVAFSGFPIGAVLGLFPVTHRGIVSAITPIAIPLPSTRKLDSKMVLRLQDNFEIYQLDATAYPGNSGSPLFDPATGTVIGIVSSVFVKETKEKVLEAPSGITYAIPVRYGRALVQKLGRPN